MSETRVSPVDCMTSWYGLNYRAQRVPDLPRHIGLGSVRSNVRYVLDYAAEGDERECWALLSDCRERGENVGVAQLLEEEELKFFFRFSVPFTVRQVKIEQSAGQSLSTKDVDELKALILIQPSMYARTVDTCLGHIRIYRNKSLSRDQSVYDDLLALAVTFTSQLNLGYTRCLATVPVCMPELVEAHRRHDFQVVATIPNGVKLHVRGTSDDLIMSKVLSPSPRPRRSTEDIEALCSRFAEEAKDVLQALRDGGMLTLPFLPKPYVFEHGFKIIVRQMEFSESELAYKVWKDAANKGQGYGQDECATLEMFQLIMLADHYCIALDDAETHELVGLTFIADSWYIRNPDMRHGETSLFLTEKYRGRGLGPESTHIGLLLLRQLGYTATLNDTLLSNSQMFKALKRSPLPPVAVGVIPDGTYTSGRGWDDQVLLLADYSNAEHLVQDFVKAAEKSLQRKTNSAKL